MWRLTTASGLALAALVGWRSLGKARRRARSRVPQAAVRPVVAPRTVPAPSPAQSPAAAESPAPSRPPVTAVFIGSDRPLPRRTPDATRTGYTLTGLPRQRSGRPGSVPAPRIPVELTMRPVPGRITVPRPRRATL